MAKYMHQRLTRPLINGEVEHAETLAKEAIARGIDPLVSKNEGLTPGIQQIGTRFASGDYFLPEQFINNDAIKAALYILELELVGYQKKVKESVPKGNREFTNV